MTISSASSVEPNTNFAFGTIAATPIFRTTADLVPGPATSPTAIVCVIDEDGSLRGSAERLIRSSGWEVQTFGSVHEFLAFPTVAAPSCLVLDAAMSEMNSLELQRRLAADRPDMSVIFVSGIGDVRTTVLAMKAGAFDFLVKPIGHEVLLHAIAGALECSRVAFDRRLVTQELRERYATLTGREREVMSLVVAGRLNKQVGAELGISEITVKAFRGNLMRKLNAESLPDLVNMAARLGIAIPEMGRRCRNVCAVPTDRAVSADRAPCGGEHRHLRGHQPASVHEPFGWRLSVC
jgi:FixJ family two-component response regulator